MVRRVVKLLIAAAVIYAGWNVGVANFRYYQFKDAIGQLALFSRDGNDEQIRTRVMELAAEHDVPLAPEALLVEISRDRTRIVAPYTDRVALLPNYAYEWKFEPTADVTHIR